MTSPATEPVEETPPPEPPPQPPPSPQLANTEETLAQAEDTLAPVIVGAILAAYLLTDDDEGEGYGPSWGVIAKGALIPGEFMLKTAAYGFREITRGAILNAIIPLLLAHLFWFERNSRYLPNIGEYRTSEELRELATRSAEFAIDRAAEAMESLARDLDSPASRDFYRALSESRKQDELDVFARRTSRWMARESLFRAQEALAVELGFTHKRWISERDSRVRADHRTLDGRAVPRTGTFQTPTGSIRYPGDVTAPIHLWINCRCSLEWLTR